MHPIARNDLIGIWQWSAAHWGEGQAETYLDGLETTFALLAENPAMAPERREVTPAVRLFPYRSHLVIFRVKDHALIVHRVVHARSKWKMMVAD